LNPIIYHTIIKEKKGEEAPAIIMEDQAALTLLRKLRVEELEQLSESVNAAQEGDRLPDSEAAGCYKRAFEINPYNDIALMSYGCALANQGNLSEGIKWVEKAVKVNPNSERARRNLQGMKRDL
jgi:tetratricopeptide (TPR) repeat protein